jgi:hypothetical protein
MTSYLPTTATTSQGGRALAQALELLEQRLRAWAADAEAFAVVLRQVYGAEAGSAAATALRSSLLGEGLGLNLEVAALPGLRGAYAAATASAGELVLLDGAWLAAASAAELEAVLLEELGHALDWRINGAIDSPGDEGEIFSALLRGETPSAASYMENDHRWIEIAGQRRLVEAAVADTTAPTVELNGAVTPSFAGSSIGFGLPNAGRYIQPVFADIDADGDLDAFIGNDAGNTLFFLNSGTATVASFSTSSIGFGLPDIGRFASPAFADIDADHDLDAFIGNADGNTVFFLNSGSASAAAFTGSSLGFGLADVGRFARPTLADIDADGDFDVFIGDSTGNTLFFLNSGTASVAAFAGSSIGFGLASVGISASPAFADIDGDGDLDGFIGDAKGNTYYFQNTGTALSAAFAGSSIGFGLPDVGRSASPTFADIDGDGDVDAFIGEIDGNTLFFLNSGGGVSSTNTNGTYGIGSVLTILVPFSETVLVDTSGGTPTLLLETGNTDRVAIYSGGSGTRLLSFTYTVQSGDRSADLDYTSSSALQLNGATIKDPAGNDANLNLPAPGSKGSLGVNADLVIEGVAPSVQLNGALAAAFAGSSLGFGLAGVGSFASPTFADIDDDGDLDAFIGNFDGSTIFFLNTGSASAASFAGSTLAFGLQDVGRFASPTFADIDSDGDFDAFIGNNLGNVIYFENSGSSTAPAFAGPSFGFGLSNAGRFTSPTFADIDGDSDLDAFIGNVYGNVVFFRNTGSASAAAFASSSNAFNLSSVGGSASPTFADIDGDGDLDAFIGDSRGSTLYFQNTGNATVAAFAASSIGFDLPDVGVSAVPIFADIDADGDLDAFIGNGDGSTLFFLNTGGGLSSSNPNGVYGIGSVITILVPFSEVVLVNIAGGVPNLLLDTGNIDRVAIYSGGSGTKVLSFTYTVQAGDSSADLDYTSSSALQLNGGSIKDATGNNASLILPLPGTKASLGANTALVIDGVAPTVMVTNPYGLSNVGISASPTFADIDADGDLDAFIGNRDGNTIYFQNTGNAVVAAFAASSIGFVLPDVGYSASPTFADIDGDGDLDAFIGSAKGNTYYFQNTGTAISAAFTGSSIGFNLPNLGYFVAPTFADIDADGDLDAFIGNREGCTIYFQNTGSATAASFAASSIGFDLPAVGYSASPIFADIDNDGDLDSFIGNGSGNTLFFLNTGSSTAASFSGSSIGLGLLDVGNFASPALVDIDGDGDLDTFLGNGLGNTLYFLNTGDATSPSFVGPGVSSANANGLYSPGSVITILVPFSKVVIVDTTGGLPTLQLETGGTDRLAIYSGGSGTSTLIFSYTVQTGDSSADLDYSSTSSLQLNGATIKDSVGNNASLTLVAPGEAGSLAANAALVIDGVAPTIQLNYFPASSIAFGLQNVGRFASPTLVDIDGDSDLDAFIGNFDGNSIFFLNTGTSTSASFAASSIGFGLPDVGFDASPTLVDIDADGDLDAFIGNFDGSTIFFLNTGSATEAAFTGSSIGFGLPDVGYIASPSFVDIDSDGDLDAFIGNNQGSTLFFLNTGNATNPAFAASSAGFDLPDVGNLAHPTFADIDGDADFDVFIGNSSGSTIFFLNTGTANVAAFAGSSIGYSLPDVGSYAAPTFADIDSDGLLDAFIGNNAGDTIYFPQNPGGISSSTPNGTYGTGSVITILVPFSEPVLVDTSGGLPSLLLETGSTDRVAIYSGGSGTKVLTFTYTVQQGDTSTDLDYTSSSSLQLNGGTIKDAANNAAILKLPDPGASGSLAANAALVIDGVAPTVMVTNPFELPTVGSFASPDFVDIDADGDLDAFIGDGFGSTIFFLNTGSSTAAAFAGSSIGFLLPDVGFSASPVFADIDADGDLDAFIGNRGGSTLFFRNSGSPSSAAFSGSSVGFDLPDVGSFASPTFADIDGDSDLDAFIGNSSGETLFFLNTGTASIASYAGSSNAFNLPRVGSSASPTFVDIDGDGDLDAFIGNNEGNTLFFRNTGNSSTASFAASSIGFGLVDAVTFASPSFADIDGDNDLDAFIGNGPGNIIFFLNAGNSTTASFEAPGVRSSNANGAYGPGSTIVIQIAFSEIVLVDTSLGVPSLELETGHIDRFALYSGGSGTKVLSFTYTVQQGDSSLDLDYTSSNALKLNGGSITDIAGNSLNPNLPLPGRAFSLAANANLLIYSDLLLTGTPLADTLIGGFGDDTIDGLAGNDSLDGASGNDSIIGGDGNDTLIGGPGTDTMSGGAGDDSYVVDTLADLVIDNAGSDTINSTISYTLPSFIEHLWLRDTAANGTGNNLDNRLYGNAVANYFDGGDGNDTLKGAAGDDTMLGANGNDTLQGDNGNDSLIGAIGNDSIDGGIGDDTMDGGAGNDFYYVDSLADQVIDSAGTDTIFTFIS